MARDCKRLCYGSRYKCNGVKFGMQTMHMDGTILKPSERDCADEAQEGNVVLV